MQHLVVKPALSSPGTCTYLGEDPQDRQLSQEIRRTRLSHAEYVTGISRPTTYWALSLVVGVSAQVSGDWSHTPRCGWPTACGPARRR